MEQIDLFGNLSTNRKDGKTYRAIRHDIIREKQGLNSNSVHHPSEKSYQINKVLEGKSKLKILELFSGNGNCTKVYSQYGNVVAHEKSKIVYESLISNTKDFTNVICKNSDSFLEYHNLIFNKSKFDVVDLDPYGFPNRFFPDVFLLIENGMLFITMPKPYVNILNGITSTHLTSYFGEHNPSKEVIIEKIAMWGLCHWRKVELVDTMDCKSIWRFCFSVNKVKATDYTGVKNR
jgi:hypothetical protein